MFDFYFLSTVVVLAGLRRTCKHAAATGRLACRDAAAGTDQRQYTGACAAAGAEEHAQQDAAV